jgi:hypothetical protein
VRAGTVSNLSADRLIDFLFTMNTGGTIYLSFTFYDYGNNVTGFIRKNPDNENQIIGTFYNNQPVTAFSISATDRDVFRFGTSLSATAYGNVTIWCV